MRVPVMAQVQIGGDSLVVDYGRPQDFEIGGVVVTGTQFLDPGVLINISGLTVGDTIAVPGDAVSGAIRNLWKQGLFSDVKVIANRIQGRTIFLELRLTERPRLSKFSFKGVSKSEADKIRESIRLERDKVITENVLTTTKNSVRAFYIDKGYLDAQVDIREIRDSSYANREILEIIVDKKERIRVGRIEFTGNNSIPASKLRRAMKDTKEKRWYKIFTSSKFLDEKYQDDKVKIVAKYNETGHRDARIERDSLYRIDKKHIGIRIWVDEGNQYFFRNITWVGNTKHTSQELSSILGIKRGDIFDQTVLDERLYMNQNGRDVSSLYMDDGYLFFSVTPVEVAVEHDSIDLEMRVYEGRQARINRVTVSGNTKTNSTLR